MIAPVPNTTLEGPAVPLKDSWAPAELYSLRKSQFNSVLKKVNVITLPMASEVGVMEHVWLTL